ncbi:MAG: TlpA family protein disulfide reductase [Gammaproteobacteria bacterium]|nr:TlpA family protein disulfide reductase [Gammaproteobacteria bacterium]
MKTFSKLLLLLLLFNAQLFAATPGEVKVSEQLRKATLQGLNNRNSTFEAYKGKPLIINVWASWCGPCREEMGSLENLSQQFNGRQFNIIGISTDDYKEFAMKFIEESGVSFNNYIDSKLFLENMLGADRIPLTILVDKNGKVLRKVRGAYQWDHPEIVDAIAKAFNIKLKFKESASK